MSHLRGHCRHLLRERPPPLPMPGCTSPHGCRCRYFAVLDAPADPDEPTPATRAPASGSQPASWGDQAAVARSTPGTSLVVGAGAMILTGLLALFGPPSAAAAAALAMSAIFALSYVRVRMQAQSPEESALPDLTVAKQQGLGIYDPDTGLLAPWYFDLRADEECRRANRYGRDLTLMLVELVEGREDSVSLTQMSDWLSRNLRLTDLSCHLGRGRYAILLTETGADGAAAAAARLRGQPVHVRVAHASFSRDGRNYDDLLAFASRRLERLAAGG